MFHRLRSEVFLVEINGQTRRASWNELDGLSIAGLTHAEAAGIVSILGNLRPGHGEAVASQMRPHDEPEKAPSSPPPPPKAEDPAPAPQEPPTSQERREEPKQSAENAPVVGDAAGSAEYSVGPVDTPEPGGIEQLRALAQAVVEKEAAQEEKPLVERHAVPVREPEPEPEADATWEPLAEPEDEPIQEPAPDPEPEPKSEAVDAEPVDMWEGIEIESREDKGSYQKLTLVTGERVKLERTPDGDWYESARVTRDGEVIMKDKPKPVAVADVSPPDEIRPPAPGELPDEVIDQEAFGTVVQFCIEQQKIGVEEESDDGKPLAISIGRIKNYMLKNNERKPMKCLEGLKPENLDRRISRIVEFAFQARPLE